MTWTPENNRFGLDLVPSYAVAARREDVTGFPSAWVGVGTLDLFYEEDVAYAEKLKRCGSECELVIVPGAFHGFDVFDQGLPIVREFHRSQIAALRRHLVS